MTPNTTAMDISFPVPLRYRRGSLRGDEAASVQSGLDILAYVDKIRPLREARILDFGCGVKLVQALLQTDAGIARYVGVDVYAEMIDYLCRHVPDKRFAFGALNFRNDMYKRDGEPMTGSSRLPIEDTAFDLITMFSVVTHMTPADASAALEMLRHYAAPECRLVFSAFVDATQEPDFVDTVPDRPLLRACYRPDFLAQCVTRAGWRIEEFRRPIPKVIQHHYICAPA